MISNGCRYSVAHISTAILLRWIVMIFFEFT